MLVSTYILVVTSNCPGIGRYWILDAGLFSVQSEKDCQGGNMCEQCAHRPCNTDTGF